MPPLPSLVSAFKGLTASMPTLSSPYKSMQAPIASYAPAQKPAMPNIFGAIGGFFQNAYNQGQQMLSAPRPTPGVSSPAALGMPTVSRLTTPTAGGSAITASTGAKSPVLPNLSIATPTNASIAPAGVNLAVPNLDPSIPMTPERQAALRAYGASLNKPAAPVTGNSGTVVDPNTGGVLGQQGASAFTSQPISSFVDTSGTLGGGSSPSIPYGWDAQTYAAFKAQNPTLEPTAEDTARMKAAGAMAVPSFAGNPLITNPQYEAAYNAYQQASTPGQQEIQAMTDKANLDASLREAYTNTEGQPIALDFITGQKAAEQRSYTALSAPIEASLALAQAKRQLAMTASKTALDREQAKLAAVQELAKPVSTPMFGTTSRFNVQTGKYESFVNPFGTGDSAGAAPGATALSDADILGQLAGAGISVPRGPQAIGLVAAIKSGIPPQQIVNNQAAVQFLTSADTQKFIANSNTALNTINDPTSGIRALSANVPRGNIQVLNNGLLAVKAGVSDPATIKLVTQSNILADEVGKLLGSAQGSDFTIKLGQTLSNPNLSDAAFNSQMDVLTGRVQNKVSEYLKQGTVNTGKSGGAFSNSNKSSVETEGLY